MLEVGAERGCRDKDGTALMLACCRGDLALARLTAASYRASPV